jgi:hypothetical protein
MTAHTIFFSWQSDTPTGSGRNFIERALSAAKQKLAEDLEVEPALRDEKFVVDMDTRGVAGTPPIVETIFKKIDAACAFVADLTFIGTRRDGRPTPNPNVLLEYGWALKSRGYSRIIVLMNTAYGEPSDQTLPFNMKHLRHPITYYLAEGANDAAKRTAREQLAEKLRVALKAIVESQEFKDAVPKPPVLAAFTERTPDGAGRFRPLDQPIGVIETPFGEVSQELKLANGPAIWLRVMPDKEQSRQWTIAELRTAVNSGGRILLPMGNFGTYSRFRAADGYGYAPTMSKDGEPLLSVIIAFKSGEVWSTYCGPLSLKQEVGNMEPWFVECFLRCIALLRDGLKVDLPYRWIAGMDGIKGKRMYKTPAPGKYYVEALTGQSLEHMVMERGVLNASDPAQLALRPFFRKLYDVFGAERSDHMDAMLMQQYPDPR